MSLLDRFKTANKIKVSAQAAILRRTSASSIAAELEAAPITLELYKEYFDVLLPLVAQYFQYEEDEAAFMRKEGRQDANVVQITTQWMIEAYMYDLKIPGRMLKHCYLVFRDCAERNQLAGPTPKPISLPSKLRSEVRATLASAKTTIAATEKAPAVPANVEKESVPASEPAEAVRSMRERFRRS
jgi:hypothetical protein